MKHINFTFSLDRTFVKSANYRELNSLRKAGKSVDAYYHPKDTGIYISWNFAGKYCKEYTGVNILPMLWDWRLKQPVRKHTNYLELSVLLNTILSKVQKEYLRMRSDGIQITGDTIREMVKRVVQGDHTSDEKGKFWIVFDEFIKEKELLTAPATVVKYKTLKTHLQAYENLKTVRLTFDDINMRFHNDFIIYCIGKGFLTNTTGKLIAMTKAFMNYAYERKFTRNLEFKKFPVRSEVTECVFLALPQVYTIERLDLGTNESQSISRDIFIIGCFTGQRISDLLAMKRSDLKAINGELWWHVHQVKTRKVVKVFLISKARKIIEKYIDSNRKEDRVFPKISPVIINRNLKLIGKLAGLNTLITKVNYCGNKKQEVIKPAYMFLTTHVARKTFITALSASNMPDHEIQLLSGHSSSRELAVYKGRDSVNIKNQLIALFEPISIVKIA